MESKVESGCLMLLSLVTKCDGLLPLAGVILFTFLATAVLQWATPGGPAWGRYRWARRNPGRVIPGPRGLPVVGSMGLMRGLAHRQLAAAATSSRAERLMALSLGATRVIVTCDPDVAKEILNSPVFADRPVKESAYGLMFDRAIGFAPYGAYWRFLRRIAATHLFSPKQIAASGPHRARIAAQMATALGGGWGVREVLKRASLNSMMSSVFGRWYELSEETEETAALRGLVDEGYDLLGELNWSDHVPMLAGLDLQRIRFRCAKLVPDVNRFVSKIIDEHRREFTGEPAGDFVDVLLSLQGPDRLSDADMIAVLWEMIFRGTDTVAVLIEWALARIVAHRDVQARLHEELDRAVGQSRAVAESDVASLAYLQAVVNEVLRIHPPGPLLSWARISTEDVHVDGCHVPAGTTAMVNMWAITHDPHVWESPLEFRPERFVSGTGFSVTGSDLRLAPFGSGRRSCPGKALAMATATFWLATLLHEFEWGLPKGGTRVDFSEVLRLSCELASPLTVQLQPRRRSNRA